MIIRKGTEKDYNEVLTIERENMKPLIEGIDKQRWSDFITVITIKRSALFVYEERGNIIGHYYYSQLIKPGHIGLNSIQVKKEFQNKGIGTRLLKDFLERIKKEDAIVAALYVFKGNRAINFYKRGGFTTVNIRILKNYIRRIVRITVSPYTGLCFVLFKNRYQPGKLLSKMTRISTKLRMERKLLTN